MNPLEQLMAQSGLGGTNLANSWTNPSPLQSLFSGGGQNGFGGGFNWGGLNRWGMGRTQQPGVMPMAGGPTGTASPQPSPTAAPIAGPQQSPGDFNTNVTGQPSQPSGYGGQVNRVMLGGGAPQSNPGGNNPNDWTVTGAPTQGGAGGFGAKLSAWGR